MSLGYRFNARTLDERTYDAHRRLPVGRNVGDDRKILGLRTITYSGSVK